MTDKPADNVIMMNQHDFVNMVQRQAVELARVLDVPGPNLTLDDVVAHVERMLSFAKKAKAIDDKMKATAA